MFHSLMALVYLTDVVSISSDPKTIFLGETSVTINGSVATMAYQGKSFAKVVPPHLQI
jgi:hypothetical protein